MTQDINSSIPGANPDCAFNKSLLPLIVCNEDMIVLQKSRGVELFHNNIKMSSSIGKYTDEATLASMKADELNMHLKFSTLDGHQMFMMAYRTLINNLPYYIFAFPALSHVCLPDDADSFKSTIMNIRSKFRTEMRYIADKMLYVQECNCHSDLLRNAKQIGSHGFFLDSSSKIQSAFNISSLFNKFQNDFGKSFNLHKCTLNCNVSDRLADKFITMRGGEGNILSLFTIFVLTLYLISADYKIDISVKRTRYDNAMIKFSTKVISDFFDEIHSWFISSRGSIELNTLSVGFFRIGHPFALDILLASAFIGINNWKATINRKENQYVFSVSLPYSSVFPSQTDIILSSNKSTLVSDIIRDAASLIELKNNNITSK